MGSPAARLTDNHTCPATTVIVPHVGGPVIAPGAPLVIIGGAPAARLADFAVCTGPLDLVAGGAAQVLINQLPAARVIADPTIHGGSILPPGELMVLIGGPAFVVPANFKLHGSPEWQNKVIRDLYYLSTLPSGKNLIERLAASDKDIDFKPASNDDNTDAWPIVGPTVNYDPDYNLQTREPSGLWSPCPPQVALGHEMVHALGDVEGTAADGKDPTVPNQPDIEAEEARTIGIGRYAGTSPTENSIRSDMGLPSRGDHYGRDPPPGAATPNYRPGGY